MSFPKVKTIGKLAGKKRGSAQDEPKKKEIDVNELISETQNKVTFNKEPIDRLRKDLQNVASSSILQPASKKDDKVLYGSTSRRKKSIIAERKSKKETESSFRDDTFLTAVDSEEAPPPQVNHMFAPMSRSEEMAMKINQVALKDLKFPGFKWESYCPLPNEVSADELLEDSAMAVSMDNLAPKITLQQMTQYLTSSLSNNLLVDYFWWAFCEWFRPRKKEEVEENGAPKGTHERSEDVQLPPWELERLRKEKHDSKIVAKIMKDQDQLFTRISRNFVKLMIEVPGTIRDPFFNIYYFCIARSTYLVFFKAFPKTRYKFSSEFKQQCMNHLALWTLGRPPSMLKNMTIDNWDMVRMRAHRHRKTEQENAINIGEKNKKKAIVRVAEEIHSYEYKECKGKKDMGYPYEKVQKVLEDLEKARAERQGLKRATTSRDGPRITSEATTQQAGAPHPAPVAPSRSAKGPTRAISPRSNSIFSSVGAGGSINLAKAKAKILFTKPVFVPPLNLESVNLAQSTPRGSTLAMTGPKAQRKFFDLANPCPLIVRFLETHSSHQFAKEHKVTFTDAQQRVVFEKEMATSEHAQTFRDVSHNASVRNKKLAGNYESAVRSSNRKLEAQKHLSAQRKKALEEKRSKILVRPREFSNFLVSLMDGENSTAVN